MDIPKNGIVFRWSNLYEKPITYQRIGETNRFRPFGYKGDVITIYPSRWEEEFFETNGECIVRYFQKQIKKRKQMVDDLRSRLSHAECQLKDLEKLSNKIKKKYPEYVI